MIQQLMDLVLHMDQHLVALMHDMGPWLYALMFLIIFAETGLVITPFLPGDSLLFALGALTAIEGSPIDVYVLWVLLVAAGILGDTVNYHVGRYIGPRIFASEDSWLLNKKHLLRTQVFYEKHGTFTIIVARFLPIFRTFAPFVAGIGQMQYARFIQYNVVGALLWVTIFLFAGRFFGNMPAVKNNFHVVILAIIVISALPIAYEFLRTWRRPPAQE